MTFITISKLSVTLKRLRMAGIKNKKLFWGWNSIESFCKSAGTLQQEIKDFYIKCKPSHMIYHTNEKTAPRQCPSARVSTPGGGRAAGPHQGSQASKLDTMPPPPPKGHACSRALGALGTEGGPAWGGVAAHPPCQHCLHPRNGQAVLTDRGPLPPWASYPTVYIPECPVMLGSQLETTHPNVPAHGRLP